MHMNFWKYTSIAMDMPISDLWSDQVLDNQDEMVTDEPERIEKCRSSELKNDIEIGREARNRMLKKTREKGEVREDIWKHEGKPDGIKRVVIKKVLIWQNINLNTRILTWLLNLHWNFDNGKQKYKMTTRF